MNRVNNATEFSTQLSKALADYEIVYRPLVESARARFASNATGKTSPDVDEALEAHVRHYFVNAFLNSLNWRLDARPDDGLGAITIPEAPILPSGLGNMRFLDYLGMDCALERALLIVETKRPNSSLPSRKRKAAKYVNETLPELLAAALANEADVGKEWGEWLETLRDYTSRVRDQSGHPPHRVVMTNGRWLIIFIQPSDSFLGAGAPDPGKILVFEERDGTRRPNDEIEERAGEIFEWLEHQRVLGETPPLDVGEIGFHVEAASLTHAMYGLHLLYIEQKIIWDVNPVIHVSPIIFLRSRYGAWFQVEVKREEAVPHDPVELEQHLQIIDRMAAQLLRDVNTTLGTDLRCMPLEEYYSDEGSFEVLKGVRRKRNVTLERSQEFVIVTGDHSHYLLPEPTVPGCPYHDWVESNGAGHPATPIPIVKRDTKQRSFFFTKETHHCSHGIVSAIKRSPLTDENRHRCGTRSGGKNDAFCEIAPFELHLCCRTCAFQVTCDKAEVFNLPCSTQLR